MRENIGFTLVELIVVIVILSILAATALPKFINIGTEAKLAKLNALASTINSAATLANAKCQVTAGCMVSGFSDDVIATIDDPTLRAMYNGYPTANPIYSHISLWINSNGYTMDTSNNLYTDFMLPEATTPTNCKVRYNFSASLGAAPLVEITNSGC